jgi:hypothetical protein
MPVSVAVDVNGTSIHAVAPKIWQAKIGKIPVVDAGERVLSLIAQIDEVIVTILFRF